jgi:protein-S-isoprenylcysteine O-methyltransferase
MGLALIITIIGQSTRIIAFFTCKHNFTHLISYRKIQGHVLITNGIYSFLRHPAYTGYFYFATFSQIFIGNFVSFILFFCFLIKFFD